MSRNDKGVWEGLVLALTKLDGDVPLELVLEANRVDAGDGFDDGGLAVSDMTDGADVDRGLSGYHLG